jgi:hypothetical protein
MGYQVTYDVPHPDGTELKDPDVIVTWNGRKENNALARLARKTGIPCLYVEHGFYGRREYSQVDHEGILHWSSWARRIGMEDAPAEGYERLREQYPDGIPEQGGDPDGYILILGQVSGDTQLEDSPFQGGPQMLSKLRKAIPPNVEAIFRPHPKAKPIERERHKYYEPIKIQMLGSDAGREYSVGMQATDLVDALKGARFCVAINSNALVEATAMGIPCAAFGPSLGLNCSAYKYLDPITLERDIKAMMDGWRPARANVERYLAWLAARQWSKSELERPEVLEPLLSAAGAVEPTYDH